MSALEGMVVVVTGSSRGIGRVAARKFAAQGARLVITGRTAEPRAGSMGSLAEAAADITNNGGEVLSIPANFTKTDAVEALAAQVLDHYGGCDVLVNNAVYMGIPAYAPLHEITLEGWDAVVAVNLTAPMILAKAFLPSMRNRNRGVIINVTSRAGNLTDEPSPVNGFAYGATKAAMNLMTQRWARDLRPDNIAAITLDPGFVASEIVVAHSKNAVAEASKDNFGTDRMQPMDVPADAMVDLAGNSEVMAYSGRMVAAAEYLAQRR